MEVRASRKIKTGPYETAELVITIDSTDLPRRDKESLTSHLFRAEYAAKAEIWKWELLMGNLTPEQVKAEKEAFLGAYRSPKSSPST